MKLSDSRFMLIYWLFTGTGKSYDFMVNVATFGINRLWKRRMVNLMPPESGRILDLASGTGISTLAIAHRYPSNCHTVGVELRREYLDIACQKVQKLGLTNIEWVLGRAEDYYSEEPFDCISSSYLAKYADLNRLVYNSKAMLKDGGLFLMHDFTFPPKPTLARIWRLYFKLLQTIGTFFFPSWKEFYYRLPKLIEKSCWITEMQALLEKEGFSQIKIEYLTFYSSAIISARK